MKEGSGQKEDKTFIKYIAYLQVIGIVLVVLGHSFHEYPDGENGHSLLAYRMIYSFHMPLFLFASGFLFSLTLKYDGSQKKEARSIGSFIGGKFKRLIIPFIFLTVLAFVPRSMMSAMADDAIELSGESLLKSLLYGEHLIIPYFWFLQVLFLLFIISFIYFRLARLLKISNRHSCLILNMLFFMLVFFPVETTFLSFNELSRLGIYFTLGITYALWSLRIDDVVKWSSSFMFALWVAVWAILFFVSEGTSMFMLCSVAGIGMSVSLARIIEQRNISVLDHLMGANYMIFLLSWFFNVASQQVLSHFVELPWGWYTLISVVTGLYVPWLMYRWLRKHEKTNYGRVIAYVLGHSIKKKPGDRVDR